MGLSTSYSKAETDIKLTRIKQAFGSGINPLPLKIGDTLPTEYGGYVLEDVGDYGFGITEANKFNVGFLSADGWEIVDIDMPQANTIISPVFDPNSETEAQGGKQIVNYIKGYSTTTTTDALFLDPNPNDMTTNLGSFSSTRIYLIKNDTALDFVDKIKIKSGSAGNCAIEKYTNEAGVLVRKFAIVATLTVGVNIIDLPADFTTWSNDDYIGIRVNTTSSLARMMNLPASSNSGYNWRYADTSSTSFALPINVQSTRIGVQLIQSAGYTETFPAVFETADTFDNTNSTDFQGAKQIDEFYSGKQGLTLGDANYTDANVVLSTSDRTFIINSKQTTKLKATKIYIKAFTAGNIGIHKYSVDGSKNAVRIYANHDLYTLSVGVNEFDLKSELQNLEPNQFLGIVQNTSSLPGRIAAIRGSSEAYNFWSYTGNLTSSNVGAPNTSTRIGVKIDAEIEGEIEVKLRELIGNFDSKIEASFATPPNFALTQIRKSGFARNTSTGIFRLNTGELIATCSSFVSETTDHDPSTILLKISPDNGTTWKFYSRIEKSGADIGIYNGDFYYVGNTLHCIALVKTGTSPLRSKVVKLTSSDNGVTWSSYTDLVPADFYHVNSSNRIHLHNGTLYYPYSRLISGTGDSGSSVYYGSFLKSTDNGVTWNDVGISLQGTSPDNLRVEGGFITNSAGALVYWFRTTKGNLIAYNSTDNGATWGSSYTLIASIPNSMTTVKKLQNSNKWVAVFNDRIGDGNGFASRKNLKIATSTNGINFTLLPKNAYTFNDRDYPFEPCIYEDLYTNGIIVTHSISNSANTEYSAGMIHLNYTDLI